jgi:shikimate kinase / 3-dehydroquinate synthase
MAPNIVLIGMMGAGKTSVGARLAEILRRPFVDTDVVVEQHCGLPITRLFAERGENEFRKIESLAVLRESAGDGKVIAVGGGAVLRAENVEALRASGRLFYLRARPETLRERVGEAPGRPLADELEKLAAVREHAYLSAAHVVIDTDGLDEDEVARLLARRVTVALAGRSYDVIVGAGTVEELPRAAHSALIGPARVIDLYADKVDKALGTPPDRIEIPDGEAAKASAVLIRVWEALAKAGIDRSDLVVGLGGGAATDLAGLAAATYLRGIPWVAVPTSVLGMVDAAIGGKTAIDLPQGKNLVGTVWQPRLVVCDTDMLVSLPERELRGGWGEIAKYGFIGAPEILEQCAGGVRIPGEDLVRRCVEIKADIVSSDERESGRREVLNYGHTIGHAMELASGMRLSAVEGLSHGEAVAVGLTAVAELGARAGFADVRRQTKEVLDALGLPRRAGGFSRGDVERAMHSDKKRRGDHLRFVLLEEIGRPVVVDEADLPSGAVNAALDAVL